MDRQCLCEIKTPGDKHWNRCLSSQVPDSPFCDTCLDRHVDQPRIEARVAVPK